MTDNEIKKALECCKSFDDLRACYKCPALGNGDCSNGKVYISNFILDKALDLINRQQAEIERLEKLTDAYFKVCIGMTKELIVDDKELEKIKSEAIKEFAERLSLDIQRHIMLDYVDNDGTVAVENAERYFLKRINWIKALMLTESPTKIEHSSLCETDTYEVKE